MPAEQCSADRDMFHYSAVDNMQGLFKNHYSVPSQVYIVCVCGVCGCTPTAFLKCFGFEAVRFYALFFKSRLELFTDGLLVE